MYTREAGGFAKFFAVFASGRVALLEGSAKGVNYDSQG
jgi:hypothetical protein